MAQRTHRSTEVPAQKPATMRTLRLVVQKQFSSGGMDYYPGQCVAEVQIEMDPLVAGRMDTGFLRTELE